MAPRRSPISNGTKQEVITWISTKGAGVPTRAVAHFRGEGMSLDPGTVRKWWCNRTVIMAAAPHLMRVEGGGRRRALGDLEDLLLDAIIERRLRKEKVKREWIADKAREIFEGIETDGTQFVASPAWVSKFMRRNDLSLRRHTNLTVLSDEKLIDRAVSYMQYLANRVSDFDLDKTVLMDETAVFFEDLRNTTVDVTGSRHVVVRSTGFASMRVTVVLAVTASGRKLTPLVIWKNKRGDRSIKSVHSVLVAEQPKAWVDSELLVNWLDRAFPAVLAGDGQAIVWDSMRVHISVKVKAKCAQKDIEMCVIPGGLTAYLQAGDIGIYKVFKNLLSDLIDAWKRSDQVTYTRGGNPRCGDSLRLGEASVARYASSRRAKLNRSSWVPP